MNTIHLQHSMVALLAATTLLAATATIASDTDVPEAIKLRIGDGDPVAGEVKAELCQGCHGVAGVSAEELASHVPHLAGQHSAYLEKQIRNYQMMKRKHPIMNSIAVIISEADLPDIAAYYASQKQR